MRSSIYLLAIVAFLFSCKAHQDADEQYVIMLSMDGFRWDFADRAYTPNLDMIARMGVRAKSLKPAFPTKTFPNHYSIATGLYPDHHGIVMNSFYDEESGRYYAISNRDAVEDGYFYGGEPIWVTAEKQGCITGSYFWVGSEAEIGGYRPTYTKKYEQDFPNGQRIDSVISWLQKPLEVRPRLILWYFHEPDLTAHEAGPDSPEVDSVVMYLDSLLGVFLDKLAALPLAEQVNVIVTSDHGMASISNDRKVILENHLNMDWVQEIQGYNPNFNIKTRAGCTDSIYAALNGVTGIHVWKAGKLPDRMHYGTHPRTLDLIVVADSSWSVVIEEEDMVEGGAHGFDNDNMDMHAIFYAFGPSFKENYASQSFNNVDIYPLICNILGIEPAAIDGQFDHVKGLLKNPQTPNMD